MILLVVACILLFAPPLVAQSQVSIDYAKLREETAQRLSEYIRINTSNPPGNELAAARWLNDVLAKEGIRGMILDTAELGAGRANLYARLPGDRADAGSRWCTTWTWSPPRRRTGWWIPSAARSATATSGAGARWT